MIGTAEIEQMTPAERLHIMELLWRSMAARPDQVDSPAWHREVVHERLAQADSPDARFLSMTEVKQRLERGGQ